MVTDTEQPHIYTMPLAGGEPIPVPISDDEAITKALELIRDRFDDLSVVDILDPEDESRAELVHWMLLLVLNESGVDDEATAEALDYKTKEDLRAEREVARVAIDEEDSLHLRFELVKMGYHKFLRGAAQAAAAAQAVASTVQQPQPSPAEAPAPEQPPSLSRPERLLITSFRKGLPDSEAALEHTYLEPIIDFMDGLGQDVSDDMIDTALRILKEHARAVDLNSSVSFVDTLIEKIKAKLELDAALREVAERTRDLDVEAYYAELQEFETIYGTKKIKSSLDSEAIDKVIAEANKYFERRFDKGSEDAIKEFTTLASTAKWHLAKVINEAFVSQMTRHIKLSARMNERGLKDFHLAQLPPDKQEVFYGIVLEKIAIDKIDQFSKRRRDRRTNQRS